jgi:hypothetical protein
MELELGKVPRANTTLSRRYSKFGKTPNSSDQPSARQFTHLRIGADIGSIVKLSRKTIETSKTYVPKWYISAATASAGYAGARYLQLTSRCSELSRFFASQFFANPFFRPPVRRLCCLLVVSLCCLNRGILWHNHWP